MRAATLGVPLFSLLVPLLTLSAQVEKPPLQYGQRIRIETCTPICERRYEGLLVEWTADSMAVEVEGATVWLPQSEVAAIDVGTRRGFSGSGAAMGATIGGLTWAGLALLGDGEVAAAAAFGAGTGALFGGGGKSSLKAGGVGAAIGALTGAVLGAVTYREPDPCTGWFCLDLGPSDAGEAGLWGAAGGAALGFLIGGIVGAVIPSEDWVAVPGDWVRVNLVTRGRDQVGLAAAVSF